MRRLLLAVLLSLAAATGAHAGADVTHPKVCAQAATASTSDVDCVDWNAVHIFGGTGASQGRVPYYDTGETSKLNWATELLYNETSVSLQLFGGTVGTNGSRVLSLGCASTVAPTTSPADVVQAYCGDLNGADTAGLLLRTEPGGGLRILDGTDTVELRVGSTTAFEVSRTFTVETGGVLAMKISEGAGIAGFYDSIMLGNPDGAVGTSGAKVLVQAVGTCPTTSPADAVQTCVQDRNGAGTATEFKRNEEGLLESGGLWTTARSTNEASVTNSTADLHTLNAGNLSTGIPVTDGAKIYFTWRKSGAGSGTVSIGIKVNTTQIIANTVLTASDTTARTGMCEITIWNRATNFLRGIYGTCVNNSGGAVSTTALIGSADMANAAITSVIVTGVGSAANVTLGVRDVVVQRIAGY